jgi:hypothetical protein
MLFTPGASSVVKITLHDFSGFMTPLNVGRSLPVHLQSHLAGRENAIDLPGDQSRFVVVCSAAIFALTLPLKEVILLR